MSGSTTVGINSLSDIERLFAKWGDDAYTERVSSIAHAVQCAELAEKNGARSSLVVAALLHDIGHLADLEMSDGGYELETDLEHEASGARLLARLYPPSVTAPVALHVAAKRYLCAVDPAYFGTLSETSVRTLGLQGGPMDPQETRRFEKLNHWREAVELRRWDDAGKEAGDTEGMQERFTRLLRHHSERIAH